MGYCPCFGWNKGIKLKIGEDTEFKQSPPSYVPDFSSGQFSFLKCFFGICVSVSNRFGIWIVKYFLFLSSYQIESMFYDRWECGFLFHFSSFWDFPHFNLRGKWLLSWFEYRINDKSVFFGIINSALISGLLGCSSQSEEVVLCRTALKNYCWNLLIIFLSNIRWRNCIALIGSSFLVKTDKRLFSKENQAIIKPYCCR